MDFEEEESSGLTENGVTTGRVAEAVHSICGRLESRFAANDQYFDAVVLLKWWSDVTERWYFDKG